MSVTIRDRREARAADAGRAWAETVRLSLHEEGRRAAGGWPGTMSEARERTSGLGADSPEELLRLTRILYGAAKELWLLRREVPVDEE